MTRILNDREVAAATPMETAIEAIAEALAEEAAGRVETTPRLNLPAGSGFLRLMPAVLPSIDRMGFKVFNGSAEDGVRYLIALYAVSSGELLSLMDAEGLTSLRTGAVTGLAAKVLAADDDCRSVGVIGSGAEARTNLRGICAARPVDGVVVHSPSPAMRERFASEMSDVLGIPVVPVATAEAAADNGCVLVATNTGVDSGIVALREEWLPKRSLVLTIGSTQPGLRESDVQTFARADLVVLDTLDAMHESGDLLAATAADVWPHDRVMTLAQTVASPATAPDRRVFKSVGSALQDVATAAVTYRYASEHDSGTVLPFVHRRDFRLTSPAAAGPGHPPLNTTTK